MTRHIENAVVRQVEKGLSTDAIVGMFANKNLSNTDKIRSIIKTYKWQQFKKGRKVWLGF